MSERRVEMDPICAFRLLDDYSPAAMHNGASVRSAMEPDRSPIVSSVPLSNGLAGSNGRIRGFWASCQAAYWPYSALATWVAARSDCPVSGRARWCWHAYPLAAGRLADMARCGKLPGGCVGRLLCGPGVLGAASGGEVANVGTSGIRAKHEATESVG